MLTFCKVTSIAFLTCDPELSYTVAQKAVCKFSIATNRKWKDDSGGGHEETMFVDCTAWGKVAELAKEYLRKGEPVYIEGSLKLEKWESQQGDKRQKHTITVNRVIFLKPKE